MKKLITIYIYTYIYIYTRCSKEFCCSKEHNKCQMSNSFTCLGPGICKKEKRRSVLRDPSEKNDCVAAFLQPLKGVPIENSKSRSTFKSFSGSFKIQEYL
jgi:hypothetical protein